MRGLKIFFQKRAWTLSNGSVSHILESQAWNQPVNVGGSAPCLMVVMGIPRRPEGSESTYSFAENGEEETDPEMRKTEQFKMVLF